MSTDDWFVSFFDSLALDLWEAALPPAAEATVAEVDYLRRWLRLTPGAVVLDVPCGRGRHALALAATGCRVVAVDISTDAVDRLRQRAAAGGVDVDVRAGDMRDLDVGRVDAAYTLGNSVGYFSPEGVGCFFAAVGAAVSPGGRFVIDTSMVAESVLCRLESESTFEAGGITMSDRNTYDVRNSRVDTQVTFERDGARVSRDMSHWVLTTGELVRMLDGAGFDVDEFHGDVDGTSFALGSPRLLVVARRR